MPAADKTPLTGAGHRPLSRFVRAVAAGLAGLQAVFLIVGPILDGSLEASSARVVVHIEAQGGTKCPTVHSTADCVICRTLTDRGAPAAPAPLLPAGTALAAGIPEALASPAVERTRGALGSRAPPGASRHAPVA